jgi:hypothetical protein
MTHHCVCNLQYTIHQIESLNKSKETLPKLSTIKYVSKETVFFVINKNTVPGTSLQSGLEAKDTEEV